MTLQELVKIAHPILINIGYSAATEKPELPDETIIDVPLLNKPGHERMTVKQCAWGKHVYPTYYKIVT